MERQNIGTSNIEGQRKRTVAILVTVRGHLAERAHEPQNIQQGTAEFRRKEDRNRIYLHLAVRSSLLDILRFIARAFSISRERLQILRIVYMAIHEASKKRTMSIHHWKQALNHFAIMFEGRMLKSSSK